MAKSILSIYKNCFLETIQAVKKNKRQTFLLILLSILWLNLLGTLAVSLELSNILNWILLYVGVITFFSTFLLNISKIISGSPAGQLETEGNFSLYFYKINNIFFFVWLFCLLLFLVLSPIFGNIMFALGLIVGIVLNAIPEVIYVKNKFRFQMIVYAVRFMQSMWLEWFLPILLYSGLVYGINYLVTTFHVEEMHLLVQIGFSVLLTFAAVLMFLFRGFLFIQLDKKLQQRQ